MPKNIRILGIGAVLIWFFANQVYTWHTAIVAAGLIIGVLILADLSSIKNRAETGKAVVATNFIILVGLALIIIAVKLVIPKMFYGVKNSIGEMAQSK